MKFLLSLLHLSNLPGRAQISVEAARFGLDGGEHAATLTKREIGEEFNTRNEFNVISGVNCGIFHFFRTTVWQGANGRIDRKTMGEKAFKNRNGANVRVPALIFRFIMTWFDIESASISKITGLGLHSDSNIKNDCNMALHLLCTASIWKWDLENQHMYGVGDC
ncbi:unnamed protein product [Vicia faba]|uniref:Uncharacterized protein n=1 Tax=Vicia faba TaxID=3906 RepID=A0AAV1A7Z2_VICFA|nr:unnamed protein product [Vicia faba]